MTMVMLVGVVKHDVREKKGDLDAKGLNAYLARTVKKRVGDTGVSTTPGKCSFQTGDSDSPDKSNLTIPVTPKDGK